MSDYEQQHETRPNDDGREELTAHGMRAVEGGEEESKGPEDRLKREEDLLTHDETAAATTRPNPSETSRCR